MPRDLANEEARFRRWLIDKLKQSVWTQLRSESVEDVARRLLLHPEALRIAQRELTADLRRQGRGPLQVGTGTHLTSKKEIEMAFPKSIYADWTAYCTRRQLTPAVVLRSLVQHLLMRAENPRWCHRGWQYRGKKVRMEGFTQKYRSQKWPYVAKSYVTQGAFRALTARARQAGTTVTGLVRGQILELLEGRMSNLVIVATVQEMWDDETRYVMKVEA